MVAALDSNIVLYSLMEPTSAKGEKALDVMERAAAGDGVLPAQVLGEVLAVVRRRRPELHGLARTTILDLSATFHIAPTDAAVIAAASALADRHRLQIWDAVICAASMQAGATHLLSEDMHDGLALTGLAIVNPFEPANGPLLDRLLPPVV